MEIVWDGRKRELNLAKHGLDFADLTLAFLENSVTAPAKEGRFIAVGELDGALVVAVIYRPLGSEAVSIISMRRASKAERSRS